MATDNNIYSYRIIDGQWEGLDARGSWKPVYLDSLSGDNEPAFTFSSPHNTRLQEGASSSTFADRAVPSLAKLFASQMAVGAGQAAGIGAGAAETGAGSAALAGGGEVGSGYAASAPGWGATGAGAGTVGAVGADTIGGGTGTDAMVGGAGGGNAMDIGGGLTLDEFGNTTGGLFEGGPGTADAGFGGYGSGGSLTDLYNQYKSLGIPTSEILKLLGRAAPGVLGAVASSQQTNALSDMAKRYEEYGAPSRGRYETSMTAGFDPNSIPGYSGALDSASKSILARLSATGGNPYGNPSGLVEANKAIVSGTALPAIQAYQNQNANVGFGGTLNSAGSFGGQAIGSQANVYNALGGAAADVFNPPKSLAEQYADLKKAGLA